MKTKVYDVFGKAMRYEKEKGYVELNLFDYDGCFCISYFTYEGKNKARKLRAIKDLNILITTLQDMVDTIEEMGNEEDEA
jgi:hypothetical protein